MTQALIIRHAPVPYSQRWQVFYMDFDSTHGNPRHIYVRMAESRFH